MDQVLDFLKSNWEALIPPLVLLAIGWGIGTWRARHRWARKEFFDRLNVSLNIFADGKLQIRTLLEKQCEEVFLNSEITKAVINAAKRTTPEDSLLPLPIDDYWYYLNPVVNEVSEHFAIGYLRRDAGEPVKSKTYLIGLTCESAGALRQRKVRAMVIRKSVLTNLGDEPPQFEAETHTTRWTTLKQLEAEYKREPARFMEIEICF